jgi:hypothetical protein
LIVSPAELYHEMRVCRGERSAISFEIINIKVSSVSNTLVCDRLLIVGQTEGALTRIASLPFASPNGSTLSALGERLLHPNRSCGGRRMRVAPALV